MSDKMNKKKQRSKMAGKIKKIANKLACRSEGGKWVKGTCVLTDESGEIRNFGKSNEKYVRYDKRKGRKKYPGVGDLYPEKG